MDFNDIVIASDWATLITAIYFALLFSVKLKFEKLGFKSKIFDDVLLITFLTFFSVFTFSLTLNIRMYL